MKSISPLAVWINGQPGHEISVLDRGLQFGQGLFETMEVRNGHIVLETYHLERLTEGCKRCLLPLPPLGNLRQELLAAAHRAPRQVLKLIVTGGQDDTHGAQSNRILIATAWPEYPAVWYEKGIHVRICKMRIGHNPQLAGLKHLGRMQQLLARHEWTADDNIQEGLLIDPEGSVIGGTQSNIFAVLPHGVLATPSLRLAGVAGVMRRYILEHATQADLPVRIAALSLPEVMGASEIFLCNSIAGVWPVTLIGHWKYAVGPVTRRIQEWVAERQ